LFALRVLHTHAHAPPHALQYRTIHCPTPTEHCHSRIVVPAHATTVVVIPRLRVTALRTPHVPVLHCRWILHALQPVGLRCSYVRYALHRLPIYTLHTHHALWLVPRYCTQFLPATHVRVHAYRLRLVTALRVTLRLRGSLILHGYTGLRYYGCVVHFAHATAPVYTVLTRTRTPRTVGFCATRTRRLRTAIWTRTHPRCPGYPHTVRLHARYPVTVPDCRVCRITARCPAHIYTTTHYTFTTRFHARLRLPTTRTVPGCCSAALGLLPSWIWLICIHTVGYGCERWDLHPGLLHHTTGWITRFTLLDTHHTVQFHYSSASGSRPCYTRCTHSLLPHTHAHAPQFLPHSYATVTHAHAPGLRAFCTLPCCNQFTVTYLDYFVVTVAYCGLDGSWTADAVIYYVGYTHTTHTRTRDLHTFCGLVRGSRTLRFTTVPADTLHAQLVHGLVHACDFITLPRGYAFTHGYGYTRLPLVYVTTLVHSLHTLLVVVLFYNQFWTHPLTSVFIPARWCRCSGYTQVVHCSSLMGPGLIRWNLHVR